MANYLNSYLAALLNDGIHQILPVSKAQLIELAGSQKDQFGNAIDVAGALTYLLNQDATNLEAAKTYTGTEIAALAGSYAIPNGMVLTQINTAHGEIAESAVAYLNAGDIKRTATVEDAEAGTKKIDATNVEAALQELAAAIETGGSDSIVTLEEAQTPDNGYLKTYVIKQGGDAVGGSVSGKINIPKDFLVKSGTVETVETADTPYSGAVVGDKYLDFVINTKGNDEALATPEHIYIPVKDLTDIYTGTTWSNGTYGTSADVNGRNQISVALDSVTLAALAKADTAIQESNLAEVNGGKVALTGKAENVSVTAGTELTELVGEGTAPAQVQAALELIAGKVNDLNSVDYVNSVQGVAGTHDGVTLTFTDITAQTGAAVLTLSHNLGNTALLHYDSKSTNDGISETFFNSVVNS